MRPSASIDCDPQPVAQALQLLQSLLALQAEPAEGAGHGQRCAQWADVFAVRAFNKNRQAQDGGHEQAVGPGAVHHTNQKGGLEGLDLGELFGQAHGKHGHGKQEEEDGVLEPLQAVVPLLWQLGLKAPQAKKTGDFVNGLLHRTERAHPAAK